VKVFFPVQVLQPMGRGAWSHGRGHTCCPSGDEREQTDRRRPSEEEEPLLAHSGERSPRADQEEEAWPWFSPALSTFH